MKTYFMVTLMVLGIATMGCGATASQHLDHPGGPGYRVMPTVFWENGSATVTVKETDAGLGTGAVIRKDGYVITNWHVVAPKMLKEIAPDGTINIVKSSGKFEICQMNGNLEVCSPATLLGGDPERDLAVLKTETHFSHAISFRDDRGLQPFDFVYSWANVSIILPPSPFRGRYVNRIPIGKFKNKIEYLIMDLSLNPGGSGSPVFDRSGKCIGIAMGTTAMKGAPLEFVIPSHEVVAFLNDLGLKTALSPAEPILGRGAQK